MYYILHLILIYKCINPINALELIKKFIESVIIEVNALRNRLPDYNIIIM